MISIQPPTANAGDLPHMEEKTNESVKRRIPLASIPTTISIGLLIATIYLGSRIVTARRATTHPVTVVSSAPLTPKPPVQPATKPAVVIKDVTPPTPPKTAQVVPVAAVEKVIEKDDASSVINPQSGQHYIQVGALEMNAEATRRFVERLRGEKLDPHIAPGPTPALMRVLIGPFDNMDILNEKKAQLENEGIQTFVRKY